MAKKEEPVASEETGKIKVKAKKEKQPDNTETKGNVTKVKEKMKMKPIVAEETLTKVDLAKPPKPKKDEAKEDNPVNEGVVGVDENADAPQEQKEVQPEAEAQEAPVLEEITEDSTKEEVTEVEEQVEEAIAEAEATGKPLPENIQKLMDFMEETGGDLSDYVKLNQDYSKLDDQNLLYEYYKQTKPHLNNEEINFLMEDQFSYDEEEDDERDIRRKKLALKEQVANAKNHLDGLKSKYYEEIKAGNRLAPEQKKAVEFFNRYNKEQTEVKRIEERQINVFNKETNKVFNDKFKGFEYNVGEKRYRYNVKDADKVKNTQGDITNFVKKFLNKNNEMSDAAGYHKSLFTAMNPDAVANHFYNQGKADALKESIAKSKNVDMTPRQGHTEVKQGGTTYRVISGDDSSKLRVKMRK